MAKKGMPPPRVDDDGAPHAICAVGQKGQLVVMKPPWYRSS